jgi:glycosidase
MAWNVEASQLDDQRHLAHTLAILLTVGGTPSIYAGDEQGFRGVKEQRAGGDDAVRPVFPDTPGQLAPDGWGVYRLHQQLIGVRRRHLWLHHARAEPLHLTNTQLVYQVGTDRQRLLVALNLQDTAVDRPALAPALACGVGAASWGCTATPATAPPQVAVSRGFGSFSAAVPQRVGDRTDARRPPSGRP